MFWSRNKEVRTSKRETIKVTPIIPVYFSNIGIRSLSSTHYFQLRVLPIKPNTIVSWLASSTSEASILQERLSWPPPPPRFLHHGSELWMRSTMPQSCGLKGNAVYRKWLLISFILHRPTQSRRRRRRRRPLRARPIYLFMKNCPFIVETSVKWSLNKRPSLTEILISKAST